MKTTTDKLATYKNALQSVFADMAYVYLQIAKIRIKMRLVTVKKYFVHGGKDNFQSKTQNTSYIDRFKPTPRQQVSYLQENTLDYFKKKPNFTGGLWINLLDYNYRSHHKSQRLLLMHQGTSKFQKNGNTKHPPW